MEFMQTYCQLKRKEADGKFDQMSQADKDVCGCVLLPEDALQKANSGVDPRCEAYVQCRGGLGFWPTAVPFGTTNTDGSGYCPDVCKAVLKCQVEDTDVTGDVSCTIRDAKVVADCTSGVQVNTTTSNNDPMADPTDITKETDEKKDTDSDKDGSGILGILGIKDKDDAKDKAREEVEKVTAYVTDEGNRSTVIGIVIAVVVIGLIILGLVVFGRGRSNVVNAPSAAPAAAPFVPPDAISSSGAI